MNKTYNGSIVRSIVIVAVSKLLSFAKISLAVGTFWAFFSLRTMIAPLVGAFAGATGAGALFIGNLLAALFMKKTIAFSYLAYSGIPTFFASLYWAATARLSRAIVPVVCMILFIAHPQGMLAAPYALFWLIPFSIALLRNNSLFLTALGSTFTAHAVGSVLWLYGTGMAATHWYSLMPLVPAERLFLAAGMAFAHIFFSYLFSCSFAGFSRFFIPRTQ